MTSLRHHGGDKWSIRAYVGTNPLTGKPRRRSISFRADDRQQAERVADELAARFEAERDQATADAARAELIGVLAGWHLCDHDAADLINYLGERRYEIVPLHHSRR